MGQVSFPDRCHDTAPSPAIARYPRRVCPHRVRIPLILISHSGRSRSPIPVILITLFTVPEEGTADSMTWRGQLPLTV
jgi:hypothetical protein